MLNDTITVYNKYTDAGVEKWQRTVLQGVFWNSIKAASARKTGVQSVDSVQIIIPMSVLAKSIKKMRPPVDDPEEPEEAPEEAPEETEEPEEAPDPEPELVEIYSKYAQPKAWAALTDKTGTWTLQPGDAVVKGSLDVEIIKSTKELQAYDDVLTITSVDKKDFGGGMAHFEVSGK